MQLQNRRLSRQQQQELERPEFVEGELVVHLSSDNAEEDEEEEEENKSLAREERSQEGDTIEICHSLNHKSE